MLKLCSELCWQCQQNSAAVVRASNRSEVEKTDAITDALEHLWIVKSERAYYKSVCDECKENVHTHFITDGELTPPPTMQLNTMQLK